jgi:hypothetical protein
MSKIVFFIGAIVVRHITDGVFVTISKFSGDALIITKDNKWMVKYF